LTETLNKSEIAEGASVENDKDILSFEFPIDRSDLEDYLNIVDENEVWINGTINTITKTITHSFGKLIHQNVAVNSCRNDTATIHIADDRENEQ
jgi:hypothetical protein